MDEPIKKEKASASSNRFSKGLFWFYAIVILGFIYLKTCQPLSGPYESVSIAFSIRDEILSDLNNLAANAYQYKIRPLSMGGGNNSYLGYHMNKRLSFNLNSANYTVVLNDGKSIVFRGTAISGRPIYILVKIDSLGQITILKDS